MAGPVEVAGVEGWERTWFGDVEEVVERSGQTRVPSLPPFFLPSTFSKQVLCARHCARYWGYEDGLV